MRRAADEAWLEHHRRTYRATNRLMEHHNHAKLSHVALARVHSFAGHIARLLSERIVNGMLNWRNRYWEEAMRAMGGKRAKAARPSGFEDMLFSMYPKGAWYKPAQHR